MNNVIMRVVDITGEYQSLAATRTLGTFTISALPTNAENVVFEGDEGVEIPWLPGEWHDFVHVDLASMRAKGAEGDKLSIVGGTW